MTDQPAPDDYEISILDILVVLAENIRAILLVPLIVGVITLGVTFLITPSYQSVSWLYLGESATTGMMSEEVLSKVLEKTPWIKSSNHDAALKILGNQLKVTFDKKNSFVAITAEARTAGMARDLNTLLINEYRTYSLPKGNALNKINENIKISEHALNQLNDAVKKISQNINKVTPGTEGDNVARAYVTINDKIVTFNQNIFHLKQSLTGFGPEVFIQEPTLPEKPIKPKKAQITIMATLASGFLTILFVFIRTAFRNLEGDPEAVGKLARIRRGIGLR